MGYWLWYTHTYIDECGVLFKYDGTVWCVVCEPPAAVVELCSHQGCRPANCTLLLAMMSMMMMMVLTIKRVDSMTIRVVGMVVMMMVIFVKGVKYLQR